MRILVGTTEISGYNSSLVGGFSNIGVDADFVCFDDYPFDEIKTLPIARIIGKLYRLFKSGNRLAAVPGCVLGFLLFFYSLLRYDVFIFCYKNSLIPGNLDLPVLKLFKKKIIWIFHGTDIRPMYMDGNYVSKIYSRELEVSDMVSEILRQKERVRFIEKYADIIIAQPLHSIFLTKPFVNEVLIGYPVVDRYAGNIQKSGSMIRILHAPSNPLLKGTEKIRELMENIKQKYPVEYVEISDSPHDVVLYEMALCDIVIDQMFSDLSIPVLSTEACMMGKPSVVGGYPRLYPHLERYIYPLYNNVQKPVTAFVFPDKIKDSDINFELVIERLVRDSDFRTSMGVLARKYYETTCKPSIVAQRFVDIINGNIDNAWMINPMDIAYVHGCGCQEWQLVLLYREMVSRYGRLGFYLPDRKDIEDEIIRFITESRVMVTVETLSRATTGGDNV
jgi:hypothetical protein